MAKSVLVDAGFIVALLSVEDTHHRWAASQAARLAPPWLTCEAALSEAFHLLGPRALSALSELLRRGAVIAAFELAQNIEPVVTLMRKYANVPMSLADACLVRLTEIRADSLVLTTDSDFHVYRRHGRQIVPSLLPR
jgi:predicted nucleic acid-binding protein